MSTYCVHARDEEIARPHRVEAQGVLDAALAYAERWLPHEPAEVVTLLIEDEHGASHCLTLDLGTGEAESCG